jgi:acyl carrier protein
MGGCLSVQILSDQVASGLDRGAAGLPGSLRRERLRRLVVGLIATTSPCRPFSDDETLTEIGVTSADMVALLLAVESEFGVEVPDHEIVADSFRSIDTMDGMMQRLLPHRLLENP